MMRNNDELHYVCAFYYTIHNLTELVNIDIVSYIMWWYLSKDETLNIQTHSYRCGKHVTL